MGKKHNRGKQELGLGSEKNKGIRRQQERKKKRRQSAFDD